MWVKDLRKINKREKTLKWSKIGNLVFAQKVGRRVNRIFRLQLAEGLTMATRLPNVDPLEEGEDPLRWIQRFEICAKLNDWKDNKKRDAFLALVGKRVFNLLADATLPDKVEEKSFESLSKLLTQELKGQKSVIASR